MSKRKPQFVICYICGRDFTSASLPIHEPQCLVKWKRENSNLPKSKRVAIPKKPPALSGNDKGEYNIQKFNEAAANAAESLLVPCKVCGRTFTASRIEKHESICIKTNIVPKRNINVKEKEIIIIEPPKYKEAVRLKEKEKQVRKPQFALCYICGRQFTNASLPIHQPQCLEKWKIENAKLDKSHRLKTPIKPQITSKAGNHPTQEELNIASYQVAKSLLIVCKNCGRKFDSSRIEKHQEICIRINKPCGK